MADSNSVGSDLLNEIERVSAKRERWKGYAKEQANWNIHANFGPALFLMTRAIDRGKDAVQSADPIEAIRALEDLRGFDSED